MHEASLAQSIVETVLHHAEANNADSVKSVRIDLGELTFFNKEQVLFWVKIGLEDTLAKRARIIFKTLGGRIRCSACQFEGDLKMRNEANYHYVLPDFSCPQCHSQNISVIQGKEAVVRSIRIVKKS
jgi:hydrogenase nickel incorporation protein HypA/HybF